MFGGKALERADRDRLVEHPAPAGALAGRGADPATHRRERVDLGRDRVGLVKALRADQADIAAGIRAGRAGSLAGCDRNGPSLGLHRSPDLPGLVAAGGLPVQQVAPRGRVLALEHFPGHAGQGKPWGCSGRGRHRPFDRPLARCQLRLGWFGHQGHHDDGALTDADAAADTFADLDRVLHHPRLRPAQAGGLDAGNQRPGHVECLDRTGVHADAAVDAACVVDVDAIAHGAASVR